MTAKQQAILDIKECLRRESRAFIAFRTELDEPIQALVDNHIKAQERRK